MCGRFYSTMPAIGLSMKAGMGEVYLSKQLSVCVCVCVYVSITDPVRERLSMCVCLTPPNTFISNGELAMDQQ